MSDSFNSKPIAVRNRIRNQMELFAIQPYVPLAAVSEFSKPLANDKLVITLFGHATPLPLVVRHSDFRKRIFRRKADITRPRSRPLQPFCFFTIFVKLIPEFRVRNRDDRLSSFGPRSTSEKVHLPADAAVELIPDRVGTYLAGEINLQRGVYCHHVVIAGNQSRIIGVCGWVELEYRIVIHELEHLSCPQRESNNDLARLVVLARAGDHASFDQRDYSIRYQLAVNAQILAVHEKGENCVGNPPNPGLQHCPILDQARHIARYRYMHVSDYWPLEFA